VTPHGVSASISVGLRSGWVGIPFWKRRHETLTIEKRHQTLLVASKVSRDSLGYLHATRCGLSLHDHKAIDITSPSIHAHRYQRSRPLSGPSHEIVDGLRVITGLLAVRGFLLMFAMSGQQRPDKRETHDKTFPYLAYTTRYTDNTKFADQMIPGRILQC
jgi:hypothetical protein